MNEWKLPWETSYSNRLWARPAWLSPSDWLSKAGRYRQAKPKRKPEWKGGETKESEGKAQILFSPNRPSSYAHGKNKQKDLKKIFISLAKKEHKQTR